MQEIQQIYTMIMNTGITTVLAIIFLWQYIKEHKDDKKKENNDDKTKQNAGVIGNSFINKLDSIINKLDIIINILQK